MANDGEGIIDELTPRQLNYLTYLNDPKSETFSIAYQSAIKAGYSEEYAKVLSARELEWMSEDVSRRKRILNKAEKRGETLLESDDEKVAADMVKHFTKTLGKEHYSERQEVTGKDGQPILVIPAELINKNGLDKNDEQFDR